MHETNRLLKEMKTAFILTLFVVVVLLGCRGVDRATPDFLAILHIREIHEAEQKVRDTKGRYATLYELGPKGLGLLSLELSNGSLDGYRFDVQAGEHRYAVHATPIEWQVTGRRSFYSDEAGTVFQSWTSPRASRDDHAVK